MKFRPVEITDKALMEEHFSSPEHIGTDTSFADVYCWRNKYKYEVAFSDGFCFIKGEDRTPEGTMHFYHYPRGKGDVYAALEKIFAYAASEGHSPVMACMTKRESQELEELFPSLFKVMEDRDNSDYIYESEALSTLKGKKYHSKRNFINRFLISYPHHTVEEISSANAAECISMCRQWCEEYPDYENAEAEIEALREGMDHITELGLFGLLLRIDGKVVAFSLGSERNERVFITHFEKAFSAYGEGYAVINNQMAKALTRYKYINREEDMGIEGLRKAKLSYHPIFIFTKYYAVRVK